MKIDYDLLGQISADLGLTKPFVKGQPIQIKNCWHFSTDGRAVDVIFYDDEDFRNGMNRVYVVLKDYNVIVLAFSLMDNHVHFVLYGAFDECNRFMHEYARRTSMSIALRHGENNKLLGVPINYQPITDDNYLKTVICYVIKNPPVAGINSTAYDYPWSSGSLYFRNNGYWTSPKWTLDNSISLQNLDTLAERDFLKSRRYDSEEIPTIDGIVFPGIYVAYEIVEKIFKTQKSFNFFMCRTKEDDVESRGGILSTLSIPMKEMRQHKNEVCKELFGVSTVKNLNTQQRMKLARSLKARYNSSLRQIAELSGLRYEELKNIL